jgi:hypothetical protein
MQATPSQATTKVPSEAAGLGKASDSRRPATRAPPDIEQSKADLSQPWPAGLTRQATNTKARPLAQHPERSETTSKE